MAEATAGQINIGDESAGLDLLTSVPTEEEEKNSEGRTQTYSLLPQNEFSNIITTSPNISEVGVEVGNMLEAQNTVAPSPTIFTKYFDEAGNPTLRSRGDLKKTVYQIPQFKDPEDSYFNDTITPIDPVNEIIDDLNNKYLFDPGDVEGSGGGEGLYDADESSAFESFGEMAKSVAGSAATFFTTFSTPAIALDILGQVLDGGTRDDGGAPVEYPGQVSPGVFSRSTTGGGSSASMSQADMNAAAAAIAASTPPDASGMGDDSGDGGGPSEPSAPGGAGGWNLASGGTVTKSRTKAKKVPSFMDSK